jgi:hypothetical protein
MRNTPHAKNGHIGIGQPERENRGSENPHLEHHKGAPPVSSKPFKGRAASDLLCFFRGNGLNYCANTGVIEAFHYITLKFD